MQKKFIKRILILGIVLSSITSLADIVCPQQIICTGNYLTTCYVPGPNWRIDPSNSSQILEPGTYTFFLAGDMMKNYQGWCAYVNHTNFHNMGYPTVVIQTLTLSRPDFQTGNGWQWNQYDQTFAECHTTNPSLCPFKPYLDK